MRACPCPGRIWAALVLALLARQADGETCHARKPLPGDAIIASWYGAEHRGHATAGGEIFDERKLTAAHPTLPLQSIARVTSLVSGLSVLVRIIDRGPGHGRGIDLSEAAARALGMLGCGLAPVRIAVLALETPARRGGK